MVKQPSSYASEGRGNGRKFHHALLISVVGGEFYAGESRSKEV
jgi:hypothetical protein